ncbi:predicted protein [Lichtheimia corymbifera JMRC:FSU:9682]|uniref:Uncharacterized protein n=1 Tax=Lichtheimia corymbifera JMRC:FSU:9682 TaxID=1263082 RepID=A0A068S2R7_9FUNG|nr:predicted protein [Lichtheimia corymbifera JMRC:FSU:9682]
MSSPNLNKSPDKETGTQNRQQRPSYANVTSTLSSARTHSPLRESLKPTAHDNSVHSNVWKAGGSPASCSSLFFDFTSRTENRTTLLCQLNTSFSNNCGVRLHSDHSRRIVELFIDDSKIYQKARTSGLAFKDATFLLPLAISLLMAFVRLSHPSVTFWIMAFSAITTLIYSWDMVTQR